MALTIHFNVMAVIAFHQTIPVSNHNVVIHGWSAPHIRRDGIGVGELMNDFHGILGAENNIVTSAVQVLTGLVGTRGQGCDPAFADTAQVIPFGKGTT